jgi:hypothetical protein
MEINHALEHVARLAREYPPPETARGAWEHEMREALAAVDALR